MKFIILECLLNYLLNFYSFIFSLRSNKNKDLIRNVCFDQFDID